MLEFILTLFVLIMVGSYVILYVILPVFAVVYIIWLIIDEIRGN